jgi:putative ABC transport system substrate-binding protein
MTRKIVFSLLITVLLTAAPLAEAQQPAKMFRIGYLSGSSLSAVAFRTDAFRRGLRELGYVEGGNLVIEWRAADGNRDRGPVLAAELVNLKVDVIVTDGPGSTRFAKEATNRIPIIMAQDPDPVGNGFVASLARPGGNITGLATLRPEISGKRLELLKEIIPKLSRVAVFAGSTNPGNTQALKETALAAGAFAVKLQHVDVVAAKDIEPAFRAATKGRAEAVLMLVPGPVALAHRTEIVELAAKSKLAAIYDRAIFVESGGLISYGVNLPDLDRRAATYVDKILKGTKPTDLPVEQPMKFEFIINLKAAKLIGLTIPPNVLVRADRVIR